MRKFIDSDYTGLPLILCNRLIGEGTSALCINANQFVHIKRDAAKLQAGLAMLRRQDGILRPWIGAELTLGLLMAVSKTYTARVEEEVFAVAANLLCMGVSAS